MDQIKLPETYEANVRTNGRRKCVKHLRSRTHPLFRPVPATLKLIKAGDLLSKDSEDSIR